MGNRYQPFEKQYRKNTAFLLYILQVIVHLHNGVESLLNVERQTRYLEG